MTIIYGKEDLATVLRTLRRAQGKKLREVVSDNKDLLFDTAHLSKIEHGKWTLGSIDKLTEFLNYYGYQLAIVKKKQ